MKLGGSKPTLAPAEEPAIPANDNLDFGGAEETPNAAPPAAPSAPAEPAPNVAEPDDSEEQSDPKKYIEKLTGKLGQSLRTYTQNQGQPDFELEKFAINSLLSATHTAEMDDSDKQDIIKKVESSGGDDNQEPTDEPSDEPSDEPNNNEMPQDDEDNNMFEDSYVYENENFMLKNPKKNNMFQEGSNDILDEMKPCWKGYKQVGMKEKNGKEVPNCVPVNENMGESNNYMFFNNLKTIHEAINGLMQMDQSAIDSILSDGHGWALDHMATSADDIDEVYHFLSAMANGQDGYNGNTPNGYSDEHGSVELINMNEAEYKGKKVTLGKPSHGDVKKFKVFVKNSKGNVVKVNFGDPNMEIKRDNPERKKSFRARHKCDQAHDRTTPKYWSCKMWSSKPVSDIVGENLTNSNKNGIFADMIKSKLTETFMAEPFIEPAVKPETKPNVNPKEAPVKPRRKDSPFLPTVVPSVQPQPKAKK